MDMKVIGKGWQYTVYNLGHGRVQKKFNALSVSYMMMLRDAFRHMRVPILNFPRYYAASKRTALRSFRVVSESNLEPWIFGNPSMLGGCDYEQDFVTPLSEHFKHASLEEGKRTIDRFVEFNVMLLRNSMIEKYFNVAGNFGLNDSGSMVIIDLGEICTAKEEIQRQIQGRVWAAADVLSELPLGLRAYFVEKMDAAFLPERGYLPVPADMRIVRAFSSALFVFGLLGWMYVVLNSEIDMETLSMPLTHFLPFPREDTFGAFSFLVSMISFFVWNYIREGE